MAKSDDTQRGLFAVEICDVKDRLTELEHSMSELKASVEGLQEHLALRPVTKSKEAPKPTTIELEKGSDEFSIRIRIENNAEGKFLWLDEVGYWTRHKSNAMWYGDEAAASIIESKDYEKIPSGFSQPYRVARAPDDAIEEEPTKSKTTHYIIRCTSQASKSTNYRYWNPNHGWVAEQASATQYCIVKPEILAKHLRQPSFFHAPEVIEVEDE